MFHLWKKCFLAYESWLLKEKYIVHCMVGTQYWFLGIFSCLVVNKGLGPVLSSMKQKLYTKNPHTKYEIWEKHKLELFISKFNYWKLRKA